MSLLQGFINELISAVVNSRAHIDSNQNIVKPYTDKLSHNGDLGFPLLTKAWLPIVKDISQFKTEKLFDDSDDEFKSTLVLRSQLWPLKIEKILCLPDRCMIFLNRRDCFYRVMKAVLEEGNNYGKLASKGENGVWIEMDASNANKLTQHRCVLIKSVLTNLLGYSKYEVRKEKDPKSMNVLVCHAKSKPDDFADKSRHENNNNIENGLGSLKQIVIVCATVKFGKKEDQISAEEYIKKRTIDMEKMAELKYGDDKNNMASYDFAKLGRAVATFDLLKVKHTNPIPISNLIEQTCASKGAVFVMYNLARIQTVLHTFNEKVLNGYYQPLPEFENVDVSLLKEEEEWQLLYVYILGFPSLLDRCTRQIESNQLGVHSLCNFLSGFISLFSVYYHRVKVLTNNQPQLAATMNARIYLLMCIRQVLITSLHLLNIDPLDQM